MDSEDLLPKFGVGVDFAMTFHDEEDDSIIRAELGRVIRMKGKTGGGKRTIWHEPFVLGPAVSRPDVHIIAKWYTRTGN